MTRQEDYHTQEYPQQPAPMPEQRASPLPGSVQYFVDSGQFGGEHIWESRGEERRTAPITYTNTALGLIYHADAQCIEEGFFSHLDAPPRGSGNPGLLMGAHTFGEQFTITVIDGCGQEKVQRMAQSDLECIIGLYREFYEWFTGEHLGGDYEEELARILVVREEDNEWRREQMGESYETMLWPITPEEYESIEFWPVEYQAAGRVFAGLQINHILPEAGWNSGITYLFSQVNDDVSIFITIRSQSPAGEIASRHISRLSELYPEVYMHERCSNCGGPYQRQLTPPLNIRDGDVTAEFLSAFETIHTVTYLQWEPGWYHNLALWPDESLRDFSLLSLGLGSGCTGADPMYFYTREVLLTIDELLPTDVVVLNVLFIHYLIPRGGVVFTDGDGVQRRMLIQDVSVVGGCSECFRNFILIPHDETYWIEWD